ncbi:MAG: GNAT family N-acetyltransferase [Nitrospirae bacterium]|nr:GNAT family N-acetyltransferase [Nitrospirota bacterium]
MKSLTSDNGQRSNLAVTLAKSACEVREAQRLRYRIFAEECGAQLPNRSSGIDEDAFDAYCDHLIVRDTERDEVVGTYRILTSWRAKEAGQFYSETEFDLTKLKPLAPRLVEVGRSCIHSDYRQGGVITLLWAGLAQYMITGGYEYLMGCASISLADGGSLATQTYLSLRTTNLSPDRWRVVPHHRYPVTGGHRVGKPMLPPLVKGYVRLGAYICGEPGWDQQFNTADLFMLLPLSRMNPRYARHFLGAPCHVHAPAA